jgi:hypothetical protein
MPILNREVGDVRFLTEKAREGWNRKKIFVLTSSHNEETISRNKTNPGWQNLLVSLGRHCPVGLAHSEYGLSPQMVYRLIVEAEQFLALIQEGENKVSETANPETVERCVQRVSDMIKDTGGHCAPIMARQIVGMLQNDFCFVPKEVTEQRNRDAEGVL